MCLLNVPSWRGKRTWSSVRSDSGKPGLEMTHKMYYDPRDLCPCCPRRFLPHGIRVFTHSLALNVRVLRGGPVTSFSQTFLKKP